MQDQGKLEKKKYQIKFKVLQSDGLGSLFGYSSSWKF